MALILALETATKVASVALCQGDKLLCEINIQNGYTHSVALMPAVEQCLLWGGKALTDLDAVAVSVGPGSFTGVRIGVATAKALCHGLHKKLVAVSTLQALAANVPHAKGLIIPIMDAKCHQVYTAVYRNDGEWQTLLPEGAMTVAAFIEKIKTFNEPVTLVGDGVPVYGALFKQALGEQVALAPFYVAVTRAACVGALGLMRYEKGQFADAFTLEPTYLRLPQAERERLAREGQL